MLLLLFASASFACLNPTHHDGDAIRCDGIAKSMRLHGIDAPEMPGACRSGRVCTPGDPYAARDHLEALTRGRKVVCEQVDTDVYGRFVVECRANGVNIACEMIADGYAVERYGSPDCGPIRAGHADAGRSHDSGIAPVKPAGTELAPPQQEDRSRQSAPPNHAPARPPSAAPFEGHTAVGAGDPTLIPKPGTFPPHLLWPVWLAFINACGFAAMAIDKRRAAPRSGQRRIPETTLLMVATVGGAWGIVSAQKLLHHKTTKQPFARNLRFVAAVQLGIIISLLLVVGR